MTIEWTKVSGDEIRGDVDGYSIAIRRQDLVRPGQFVFNVGGGKPEGTFDTLEGAQAAAEKWLASQLAFDAIPTSCAKP